MPFAYFFTALVVYAYSFYAILKKMAENSRMSKLLEKDDECIFSWKLFTAWDYMIGNAEAAHNRVASIVVGFKEALLEEAEKNRKTSKWKIIVLRWFVSFVVLVLLSSSAYAVLYVVERSKNEEANHTVWRKNETTIVISLLTLLFPTVFELLGFLEQYHPRKQLTIQLRRIMVLNLLNLYSLIFALFDKISDMNRSRNEFSTSTFNISSEHYDNLKEDTSPISKTINTTVASIQVSMDLTQGNRKEKLCWETMFGQELIRLTVMDLLMTMVYTLSIDFLRGVFVRFMNRCCCWDLEKTFPQYGDFKVAENILHLVNNQGMVWMGMFFSPGLVVLNVVKLIIMMYLRSWVVLTCNVPHEVIFRASRSNNFYYALLLLMLFLCVLPVWYAIVWIPPSHHCGPFSDYERIFHILNETVMNDKVPLVVRKAFDYITSPIVVVPLLVLLVLVIYYLLSLSVALREANNDLKFQLRRERTEERKKMFQLVERRKRGEPNELSNEPIPRWNKLLTGRSLDETPKQESEEVAQPQTVKEEKVENKSKDFFRKFIKRALRKVSHSDEDTQKNGEDTDTEQPDSLPDDSVASKQHKPTRSLFSRNNSDTIVPTSSEKPQRKSESITSDSFDSDYIKEIVSQHSPRRYAFGFQKNTSDKTVSECLPSTSRFPMQDRSSNLTDIPLIKISKTESEENILQDGKSNGPAKFKPRIKCVFKKQSTELDADTICHFGKDLERNIEDNKIIKAAAEEDIERSTLDGSKVLSSPKQRENLDESNAEQSSSEEIHFKDTSVDTILNFPSINKDMLGKDDKEDKHYKDEKDDKNGKDDQDDHDETGDRDDKDNKSDKDDKGDKDEKGDKEDKDGRDNRGGKDDQDDNTISESSLLMMDDTSDDM